MGKEQRHDRSNLFWETEIFDEKPGSEVQIRMAKALVDIIGQDRPLTRDDFRKIERPLSLGFRVAEDSVMTQENLIRGAMRRFVNILALVAAEGDEDKAAELMGSSEHYQGLPKLTDRIREITKPEKPNYTKHRAGCGQGLAWLSRAFSSLFSFALLSCLLRHMAQPAGFLPVSPTWFILRYPVPQPGNAGESSMSKMLVLIDDLDGSKGAETIRYAFDGKEYEIDLSERHAEQFRKALSSYVEASRKVGQPPPRRTRRQGAGKTSRTDIPQIRAWAVANGYKVSERGRIKREIIEAYDQAQR